jgi:NADH-quinone oxidoreductase subunit F
VDLHLIPGAVATPDERDAIDAILDGARDAGLGTRTLLLPALHAAQARVGWISEGALNHLCERLSVPPAEAYGVASFYDMFSMKPRPPSVEHVCDDIACRVNGAEALCRDLEDRQGRRTVRRRTQDVAAQPVSRSVRSRASGADPERRSRRG